MDVKEIETAISQLPRAEVAELANWFDEFRARLWDQQIEHDFNSGKLQSLIDETREDFNAGQCEPL